MKTNPFIKYYIIIQRMIIYNLRIIFANKFIWFLAASVIFYLGLNVIYALTNDISRIHDVFGLLIFPGILIVFYPAVFGIQNDQDSRTLEILFGIPDYRYKVWLVRLIMIFLITALIMLIFTSLSSYLIIKLRVIRMTASVMLPVIFLGMLAFMLSTVIRNGNGTAVIMIILGIFLLILGDNFSRSPWNVFLNPYRTPYNIGEAAWEIILIKNKIILITGIILFLLAGLFNLQRREKFM